MNEKSKLRMERQQQAIYDNLTQTFNLPVFEDELGEDELPDTFNYFYIIYGDFRKTEAVGVLLQEIYVVYVTEDNPDVETTTLDVITMVSKVNGVVFERTAKERYQKNDTDEFVDQVNVIFSRKIAYEQD
jgi:hypothetical protein